MARHGVVVGAGDIAHATALRFGEAGMSVTLVSDDARFNDETATSFRDSSGAELHTVVVDHIASQPLLRDAVAECRRQGIEAVHALANCQILMDWSRIENSESAAWMDSITTNLLGPLVATIELLPLLRRAEGAAVVHVGSVDGFMGNPNRPRYSVAKAGLVPLTHLMAEEFAPDGVRVNAIARALVETQPATEDDAYRSQLKAETPLRRAARPAEIAAAINFLASEESSYVTGTVLTVDGGRTAITNGCRFDFSGGTA